MSTFRPGVLIIDPEAGVRDTLASLLQGQDVRTELASSIAHALASFERSHVDLVIADLGADPARGAAHLAELRARVPDLPVIFMSESADVSTVVEAMRAGATDFLQKPFQVEEVRYVLEKTIASIVRRMHAPPSGVPSTPDLVGVSPVMREVHQLLHRVAPGNATVIIRGESGTGKEVVARLIHQASSRKDGPMVKIDCTSLPDTLLESELFGYEKGAFTGAGNRKPGRVEIAEGGTLFLDEIGEVTPPVQAKLLRLLQDRQFEKLGGTKTLRADVRFVAATHRDLEAMVKKGEFRQDLFYRLAVVPVWLPPLRARRDDIKVLVELFCRRFGQQNDKPNAMLAPDAIDLLRGERWPGNVRQLENFVERLVVLADDALITSTDVRRELSQQVHFVTESTGGRAPPSDTIAPPSSLHTLDATVREAERKALLRALERAKDNRTLAARLLGVSRATLYNKLQEHDLE